MSKQVSYKRVYLADGEGVSYEIKDSDVSHMFDDVVPEDNNQKENRKDKFQLLKDIFDHTDKRIFLNQ